MLHYFQNGIINGWIRRTSCGNQSSYPFMEPLQHYQNQIFFLQQSESSYFIYGLFYVENSKLRSFNSFLASRLGIGFP
jgi:hypothetical protein